MLFSPQRKKHPRRALIHWKEKFSTSEGEHLKVFPVFLGIRTSIVDPAGTSGKRGKPKRHYKNHTYSSLRTVLQLQYRVLTADTAAATAVGSIHTKKKREKKKARTFLYLSFIRNQHSSFTLVIPVQQQLVVTLLPTLHSRHLSQV